MKRTRSNQQHFFAVSQQHASVFPSAALITAVAQPTPALTVTAATGQFRAQAPHSMQLSLSTILALPLSTAKTACGHTVTHIPQPVHFSLLSCRVTTFVKYWGIVLSYYSSGEMCRNPQANSQHSGHYLRRYGKPHFPAHSGKRCIGRSAGIVHGHESAY